MKWTLLILFCSAVALGGVFLSLGWFRNSQLEALNVFYPSTVPLQNESPATTNTVVASTTERREIPVEIPDAWNVSFGERSLTLPSNLQVSVFVSGLEKPRLLARAPDGTLFASEMGGGRVLALPDDNRDGVADAVLIFAEGLRRPHGLAFFGEALYVAEEHQVRRFSYQSGDRHARDDGPVVIPGLPTGGNHVTRTVVVGPEKKLFVSVGSSCNACEEQDERRGAVTRYHLDGSGAGVFASGVRNSVGMTIHPATGEIWATDNGRDFLGDDLPPEEVNVLAEGKHYGWPYCYGDGVADAQFNRVAFCATTEAPRVTLQAHSAPLGLRFLAKNTLGLPEEDLLIAFHGSWNRREPTGYTIVRFGADGAVSDFLTGWLAEGERKAWGRPVDVEVGGDGALYVSDDLAGVIYRVSKVS